MKFVASVLFLAGMELWAVQHSLAESINLGYVDLQKALQSVEAGKLAKADLEKRVLTKKSELEKQQQNFKKEVDDFEKKAAILNEASKTSKQAELQKKYVDMQRSAAESQMELQKLEQELTKPIVDELKAIIEGLGKEKKYQVIVEKNEGAVLYAEADSDLTQFVIERFNARATGKHPEKKKK